MFYFFAIFSHSSRPPPPAPSTNTETRLLSPQPATMNAQPSLQRQNGVCVPSRLLTCTCVPTTSMCPQMTSRRRGSPTFCPRTSSRSSLSSRIWEHRCGLTHQHHSIRGHSCNIDWEIFMLGIASSPYDIHFPMSSSNGMGYGNETGNFQAMEWGMGMRLATLWL